jgi:hypothetical protein
LQASGLLDDLGWGDDSEKSFCTSSEITSCHNGWRVQNFIKDTYIHDIGSDFLSDTICCIGVVCDSAFQVGSPPSHPDIYDLLSRRQHEPQGSPVVCYGIYGVNLDHSQGMSIRASNHPAGFAAVNTDLTTNGGGTMFGIGATLGMTNVLVKDFVWDGPGPTITAGPVADCVCENILSAGGLVAAGYVVR